MALKLLEKACTKRCFLTIMPDKRRERYFMKDNQITKQKIIHLPISKIEKPCTKKGDYLYKKFNIGKNKKIIIYAGSIAPWTMALEVAKEAQQWSNDLVLVLHDWRKNLDKDPYIKQLKKLTKNKKVYLSLKRVSWQVLPKLLSFAHIGLVFYENRSINYRETCLSSNKIASYLQVGLPIIANDYPSFKEIIGKYKCGKYTNNPGKVQKLAEEILANYSFYKKNAFFCFRAEYNFSKCFSSVLEALIKF